MTHHYRAYETACDDCGVGAYDGCVGVNPTFGAGEGADDALGRGVFPHESRVRVAHVGGRVGRAVWRQIQRERRRQRGAWLGCVRAMNPTWGMLQQDRAVDARNARYRRAVARGDAERVRRFEARRGW